MEQANNQTWNDIEDMETFKQYDSSMYDEERMGDFSEKTLSNVRYDFPYEPETFDLSEADFAPSSNIGDNSCNNLLELSQNREVSDIPEVNNEPQKTEYFGEQAQHMNGTVISDLANRPNQVGLSQMTQCKEKNVSLKLNVTQPETVKMPIQADNSPGDEPFEIGYQMNGHSNNLKDEHSDKTVQHQHLASIPSLGSINSSPEYDKYPVQCNTPQTPKDSTTNPFQAQLSGKSVGQLSPSKADSSKSQQKNNDSMQDFPKLQNLKDDLEMSCESNNKSEQLFTDGNGALGALSSQSLPPILHQHVLQNGVNSTGSLPSEFENEMLSEERAASSNLSNLRDKVTLKQQSEKQENFSIDHMNETMNISTKTNESSTDEIKEKDYIEAKFTGSDMCVNEKNNDQNIEVSKVVGFGSMDEDVDDTDINEYLGDESEALSNRETDSQLSKFSSGQQSGFNYSENQSSHGYTNFSVENQDSLRVCDTEKVNKEEKEQKVRTPKLEESDMDTSELCARDSGYSEENINKTASALHQSKNSNMDALNFYSNNPSQSNANNNPVITNLTSTLSPVANISLDSGVASLNDNLEDYPAHTGESCEGLADAGARPKDSQIKVNRPNSLMGLSTVNLKSESPFVVKPMVSPSLEMRGERSCDVDLVNQAKERMDVDSVINENEESRQLLENSDICKDVKNVSDLMAENMTGDIETDAVEMRNPDRFLPSDVIVTGRPRSWSPSDSGQPPVQKQKRPTSLNLPPPPTINPTVDREMSDEEESPVADADVPMDSSAAGNQDVDNTAGWFIYEYF